MRRVLLATATTLAIIAPLAPQASASDLAALAMRATVTVPPGLEWMFVPSMWRTTEDCLVEARFANIALAAVKARERIDPGVCFMRRTSGEGGSGTSGL